MQETLTVPDSTMYYAVFVSLVLSFLSFPLLIRLSQRLRLVDYPGIRKVHRYAVPTLGGVGIFFGVSVSGFIFLPFTPPVIVVFLATIALFLCGVWDDLKGLDAPKKFFLQVLAAGVVVFFGIRIESFHGLFGIHEIPIYAQYLFTILVIVGITNAFNLIDGLDGLAGGISLINSLLLGIFLFLSGDFFFALLAFCLSASLFAFLCFNFNPAKIFMGDTGSLPLGFLLAILGIRYLEINTPPTFLLGLNPLMLVVGLFLLPVADTVRLMCERMLKKRSPFSADQNHLHHKLMQIGFSHRHTVVTIYFFHLAIILLSCLQNLLSVQYGMLTTHSLLLTSGTLLLVSVFKGRTSRNRRRKRQTGQGRKMALKKM